MQITRVSRILTVFAGVTLLLSLVFVPAIPARIPHLLYVTSFPSFASGSGATQLVAFSLEANPEAKTPRVIGKTGTFSAALAFCPPGKMAHTVTNIFSPSPQLATLNLGTGAVRPVGSPLPPGQDIMGLACSPDGTLYAVGESDYTNLDYNSLYIINRATGVLTRIGSTGVNDGTGDDMFMALRFAADGTLYGANPFALFTIDLSTGFATKVIDFSANVVGNVMGFAIDDEGNFYVADFVPRSHVYALDTSTGVATPILDTGLSFVHSIAFRTPS
jgi:outer membrane protein assembly factor BamB